MNLLTITIFLPVILGAILLLIKEKAISRKCMCIYTGASLCLELVLIFVCIFTCSDSAYEFFRLNDTLVIYFNLDRIGQIFAGIMGIVWTLAGFFSFEYLKHEEHNERYFGTYIIVLGVLMGLCFAGNLVTYYAFYEFMTIGSFAMVLHNQSREAIMAALKYLFYSFAGAYMVLFGLYFVHQYAANPAMTFNSDGIIEAATLSGGQGLPTVLLVSMFLMILGFSVKAGMFPMHGWLPTAHPVAPAPASAVLSGIIVKCGVLGIIRVIYFIFGTQNFVGTHVQKTVLVLSLVTVFMGSMLAYKEKILKKRLAYSTVSQVSYILFGIFMINDTSMQGSLLHVVAHALIKSTLFLCAGAIIYLTGCTKVSQLRGIGKKMPVMLWCFTFVSLGLIGIPPMGGFVSKWYLCMGALSVKMPVFSILGPVILLVSALLTAGYLLPISINGFLPGNTFEEEAAAASEDDENFHAYKVAGEPNLMMLIPIIIMTVLSIVIGLFPEVLL